MYEDDSDVPDVECPECGEPAYLNPETGFCIDCDLERELGEDDDSNEDCTECGMSRAVIDMNDDGICEECQETLGLDEEE